LQEFAEKKKMEGKAREYILLNEDVELLEGNTIEIKLSNPVQEDTLDTIKTELLTFLRSKLNNESITIASKVQAGDAKKRLYTTREKFDHLAQKHPLLKELKERLGLDPDF
jgi:hypothetical protein